MSKSPTTTDDLLPNPFPGAGMREDLFDALNVTIDDVALATGLSISAIEGFLDGSTRVDADLDLRIGRYFGFSDGYFLRLQNLHDIEQVRRRAGADIERIKPLLTESA